jgi:hypothetical protein
MGLFLNHQTKNSDMKKDKCDKNFNPLWGIGSFLVAFGLLLGVIMMDLLQLGEPSDYIKWQMLLIFIGLISLFNGKVGEALILFAVGTYFLLPYLNIEIPDFVDNFYWPGAIILVGLGLIVSGVVRKIRNQNRIIEK